MSELKERLKPAENIDAVVDTNSNPQSDNRQGTDLDADADLLGA